MILADRATFDHTIDVEAADEQERPRVPGIEQRLHSCGVDPAVGEHARGVDDARDARHGAMEAVAITQVAQRNLDPRLAHLSCRLRPGQYAYLTTPAPELLDHELAGLAGSTSDEDHDSPPFC